MTEKGERSQSDQFKGTAYAEPAEVLQALGQFLMAWSALDQFLNALLAALLRTDVTRATIVSQATQGARARLDMLLGLSNYVANEPMRKRIRLITRRCQILTRKRNEIAHGFLGLSVVSNELVLHRYRLGEVMRLDETRMNPSQIRALNDEISKVSYEIFRLAQDVVKELKREDLVAKW